MGESIAIVHAPSSDGLLVWVVMGCGRRCWFSPPPCFDLQGNIDAWFEQRRYLPPAEPEPW